MDDKECINQTWGNLMKLREQRIKDDHEAEIALVFFREFEPMLIDFLKTNNEGKVLFQRSMIVQEPCDYEIRQCMDGEVINKVARLGYRYLEDESTYDTLVFERMEIE